MSAALPERLRVALRWMRHRERQAAAEAEAQSLDAAGSAERQAICERESRSFRECADRLDAELAAEQPAPAVLGWGVVECLAELCEQRIEQDGPGARLLASTVRDIMRGELEAAGEQPSAPAPPSPLAALEALLADLDESARLLRTRASTGEFDCGDLAAVYGETARRLRAALSLPPAGASPEAGPEAAGASETPVAVPGGD